MGGFMKKSLYAFLMGTTLLAGVDTEAKNCGNDLPYALNQIASNKAGPKCLGQALVSFKQYQRLMKDPGSQNVSKVNAFNSLLSALSPEMREQVWDFINKGAAGDADTEALKDFVTTLDSVTKALRKKYKLGRHMSLTRRTCQKDLGKLMDALLGTGLEINCLKAGADQVYLARGMAAPFNKSAKLNQQFVRQWDLLDQNQQDSLQKALEHRLLLESADEERSLSSTYMSFPGIKSALDPVNAAKLKSMNPVMRSLYFSKYSCKTNMDRFLTALVFTSGSNPKCVAQGLAQIENPQSVRKPSRRFIEALRLFTDSEKQGIAKLSKIYLGQERPGNRDAYLQLIQTVVQAIDKVQEAKSKSKGIYKFSKKNCRSNLSLGIQAATEQTLNRSQLMNQRECAQVALNVLGDAALLEKSELYQSFIEFLSKAFDNNKARAQKVCEEVLNARLSGNRAILEKYGPGMSFAVKLFEQDRQFGGLPKEMFDLMKLYFDNPSSVKSQPMSSPQSVVHVESKGEITGSGVRSDVTSAVAPFSPGVMATLKNQGLNQEEIQALDALGLSEEEIKELLNNNAFSKTNIHKKYRQISLEAHPDRGGNDGWFDQVTKAWEKVESWFEGRKKKESPKKPLAIEAGWQESMNPINQRENEAKAGQLRDLQDRLKLQEERKARRAEDPFEGEDSFGLDSLFGKN